MKQYFLLAFSLLFFVGTAHAQLSDRLVPRFGFMYEFVRIEAPTGASELEDFYNIHLGTYVVLYHQQDVFSVGIDPSIHAGFNFFNTGTDIAFDYTFQVPVLLMGRVGTGATPYNEQRFGAGLGIGAKYVYFSEHTTIINKKRANFISPVVVGEISFVSRGGPISIRGIFSIADATRDLVNTEFPDIPNTSFSTFGVGLLYGF